MHELRCLKVVADLEEVSLSKRAYDAERQEYFDNKLHKSCGFFVPRFGTLESIVKTYARSGKYSHHSRRFVCEDGRWMYLLRFNGGGLIFENGAESSVAHICFHCRTDRWVKFRVVKDSLRNEKNLSEYLVRCHNLEQVRMLSMLWREWHLSGAEDFSEWLKTSGNERRFEKLLAVSKYRLRRTGGDVVAKVDKRVGKRRSK